MFRIPSEEDRSLVHALAAALGLTTPVFSSNTAMSSTCLTWGVRRAGQGQEEAHEVVKLEKNTK